MNSESFVAFLDFEKALDRVNHNLILETLQKIGFSTTFVLLIQAIL
jgi:hypothetical protein